MYALAILSFVIWYYSKNTLCLLYVCVCVLSDWILPQCGFVCISFSLILLKCLLFSVNDPLVECRRSTNDVGESRNLIIKKKHSFANGLFFGRGNQQFHLSSFNVGSEHYLDYFITIAFVIRFQSKCQSSMSYLKFNCSRDDEFRM